MLTVKELNIGNYLLIINQPSNSWHLLAITEIIDDLGVETTLINTSLTLVKNLIGEPVYLSQLYFEGKDCIVKKLDHKPDEFEILAMIL